MTINDLKYPIYIVSKGRYETPYTANFLKKENIPFFIVVEPQEYSKYCETVGSKYTIKLPFSNLGLGSYPARNFCWEHSKENKHKKHFLFDDNIRGFRKLEKGSRVRCEALPAILSLQNFTEKFKNVPLSGWNYSYFITKDTFKPFFINTHVYSGMLIDNLSKYKWRLKYNEDVDLSLQVLHDKQCTILLNAYMIEKISTVAKLKGGNQDELYKNNDKSKKLLKSYSLQQMWPQYVKVVTRFGRPHHQVSWSKFFKQPLLRRY